MPKLTRKRMPKKPSKPHPDFPLFAHGTGRWAKKVRGKLVYFGPWADPDAAAQKWAEQKDDLLAGRKPRTAGDGTTIRDLVIRFLTTKRHLLDTREIAPGTFGDYYATCERIIGDFGKSRRVDDLAPDDFEGLRASMAKTLGPVALGNEINRVRIVLKYAYDQGLIDRPLRYGQSFKRPSRKTLRQARHEKGLRMFEAGEVQALLNGASVPLQAMILLGINAGLGNTDVASLPLAALDLKAGWLNFPRPKTGIPRRVPLWPKTVKALKAAIAARPVPKDQADADLAFVTKYGRRWVRVEVRYHEDKPDQVRTTTTTDSVALEFGKLLRLVGLHRPGLGFYSLRHGFETIAGESRDQVAVNAIMGHAPVSSDMSAVYRERISDERLQAVVGHVRQWLFPNRVPR